MWSLEFFIDLILPASLCPCGRVILYPKRVQEYFVVSKGGQSVRLTAYHLHVPTVFESGSLSLLEFLFFFFFFIEE
jgi:hypothetical protein